MAPHLGIGVSDYLCQGGPKDFFLQPDIRKSIFNFKKCLLATRPRYAVFPHLQ